MVHSTIARFAYRHGCRNPSPKGPFGPCGRDPLAPTMGPMRLRRPAAAIAVLVTTVGLLAMGPAPSAYAAASAAPLDPTYGDAGIARVPTAAIGNRIAMSTTTDPHGQMVVKVNGGDEGLVRFTADGHLDESFGVGGLARIPSNFGFLRMDASDDAIVLGGSYFDPVTSETRAAVMRLHADGTPDTGFGGDGIVAVGSPSARDTAMGVDLGSDGSVAFVVGLQGLALGYSVYHYRADGSPDPAFGTGGGLSFAAPAGWQIFSQGLRIDSVGRVTFAEADERQDTNGVVVEARTRARRLLPSGALDPTFGSGGISTIPTFEALFLSLDPSDGSLLLGGVESGHGSIAKLRADGQLDRRFGGDGTALGAGSDQPSRLVWGLAALPDGRVVAQSEGGTEGKSVASVLRPDGTLETAFGDSGVVATDRRWLWDGVGAGADGRILIATGAAATDDENVRSYRPDFPDLPNPAPAISTVSPRRRGLSVAWTAPEVESGGPVRAYYVTASVGTTVKSHQVVAGDVRQTSLTGLDNGTTYNVVVVPYTSAGPGSSSAPVSETPSAIAPATTGAGPVRALAASPGRRFATVTWAPPADDGGAPISAYSVIAINHASGALVVWRNVPADVRLATVPDLTVGVAYDVYIVAATPAGFGAIAPAVSVTPTSTTPAAQPPQTSWVSAVPAGASANVAWGPAVERGEAVTHYNVIVIQGGSMTAWQVTGPDQRQATVPLGAQGPAQVYVVAQSKSGYGPLPDPVAVSRAV
jgi:uncharacterized delta-60 repeat protein